MPTYRVIALDQKIAWRVRANLRAPDFGYPAYVDVAVLRWQAFTGKHATLEGDVKSFEQIAAERGLALDSEKTDAPRSAATA